MSHAGGDPAYDRGFVWVGREPALRFGVSGDGQTAQVEQYEPLHEVEEWLLAARPGDQVCLPVPGQPPWIVVHHALDSMTSVSWPGRLLEVRAVLPPPGQERAAVDAANQALAASRRYTRAAVVDVLTEVPAHVVFGPHGQSVAEVIEVAARLTPGQAQWLAAARHANAPSAYERAWDRWAGVQAAYGPAPEPGPPVLQDANGSPVGGALSEIHHQVTLQAARHHAVTWVTDRDDRLNRELVIAPAWLEASYALLEAAIALGDPVSAAEDREVLTAAWRSLPDGGTRPGAGLGSAFPCGDDQA